MILTLYLTFWKNSKKDPPQFQLYGIVFQIWPPVNRLVHLYKKHGCPAIFIAVSAASTFDHIILLN